MKDSNARGIRGENTAALYMEKSGFVIIERNYRRTACEVDIIALEGDVLISPASLAGALPRCGMREEEYTEAVKLFAALGTSDAQGQEELLLHYEGVFNAFYAEATEAKKKYGALYTKLGIAVGVLLLILLL